MVRKHPVGGTQEGVPLSGEGGFRAPSHMMVCAVPVTVGCREVRGPLAHCAPHSPPWSRGGWGTAPQRQRRMVSART